MSSTTIGAVYCVYEDSGFLRESIGRIYPLMKSILILIDHKPWMGTGLPGIFSDTIKTVIDIPDPENKITQIWGHWNGEADQRNAGLAQLRLLGCQWCLVIDDDEMYNRAELEATIDQIGPRGQPVYLINFLTYWKSRDLIIPNEFSQPCIVSTEEGKLHFKQNRWVIVNGTWAVLEKDLVMCHHFSYIRSDEKMLRKIQYFSHASEIVSGWYDNVWLKWFPEMGDLHPTSPAGFPKAIPVTDNPYQLEEYNPVLGVTYGL